MTPEELATMVGVAAEAAELVNQIYQRPFRVDFKGPEDPVTEADRAANQLICERLHTAFPSLPIVAEESAPETFGDYRNAERVFFVDPVDGTREFVQKNGEFVVMIALLEGDQAQASVIHAPVTGTAWVGLVGYGAFELKNDGSRRRLTVSETADLSQATIVSSRSHRTSRLEHALSSLNAREVLQLGSAGLKGAQVAAGNADAYVAPHYAGQRWDVCATDALVRAAGGVVTDALGQPFDYRSRSLRNDTGCVACNPRLHPLILERLALARAAQPD